MKIEKGTLVKVSHSRKGEFTGIATDDFDTEDVGFYPIALAENKAVMGMDTEWFPGENVPCKSTLCTIEKERDNES